MVTRAFIRSAGLLVTEDGVGVEHLRLGPGVPARIRRFSKFIRIALLSEPGATGVLAARLVALDGTLPSALDRASLCIPNIFTWRDAHLLEWREEDPPRLERRALSAPTLRSLDALEATPSSDAGPESMRQMLDSFLKGAKLYPGVSAGERIRELERDALCWWYQCLPLTLFFHLSGLQPMSAVTRSCLAREQTRRPLAPSVPEEGSDGEAWSLEESCADMLDMAGLSTGPDNNATLLKQALDLLTSPEGESDAVAKRRWVGSLLNLRMRAVAAGPITALLLAWSVDLVESGTIHEPNPPKETPQGYLRKALLPLFDALKEIKVVVGDANVATLRLIYETLIDAESVGSQGTMASALSNFHHFLSQWLEVPPLTQSLHADVPVGEVRALVVWDHETDQAIDWCFVVTNDPALAGAVQVCLAIARESPCRPIELAFVRRANVHDCGTHLEIEIVPSLRYGRLKTTAAQRRLYVRRPEGIKIVREWVSKHKESGLGDDTLLFREPMKPRSVYRRAAMCRLVGALLRAASGEPTVVGYALRHTVVSLQNEPILMTSSIGDINRFAETAVGAGHATGTTSILCYSHLYEVALRQWIDAAIATLVDLNSQDLGSIAGMTGAALRQRACFYGAETQQLGWVLSRRFVPQRYYPKAADAFDWADPVAPVCADQAELEFGPAMTLMMLQWLAQGRTPSEIAASLLLEEQVVENLAEIAFDAVVQHGRTTWVHRCGASTWKPACLVDALETVGLDLADASQQKFDELRRWLQAPRPVNLLDEGVKSWKACRRGEYLSLDQPLTAVGLYRMVQAAGVNPALLRVCVRGTHLDAVDAALKASVIRDFVTGFRFKPELKLAQPRARVPCAYLQWDSEGTWRSPHASSGSLGGLDAWMLAIAIHLQWKPESRSTK